MIEIRLDRLFHGARTLLENVLLEIPPEGKVVLSGETGSGKTSLIHTLNRMTMGWNGAVKFHGEDVREMNPIDIRHRIVEVMQEPFLGRGKVIDSMRKPFDFRANRQREFSEDRLKLLLNSFKLPEEILNQSTEKLSGGEKQRVAMVRAMMLQPEVLLLDEPSSALDKDISRMVLDFILHRCPAAVLCISHDPVWQEAFPIHYAIENLRLIKVRG